MRSRPGRDIPKTIIKKVETASLQSPGINHMSRVSYHGPGFLSSATWPSLLKKHYNGLIIIINQSNLTGQAKILDISLFDQIFFIYFNPISFRILRLVVSLDIK